MKPIPNLKNIVERIIENLKTELNIPQNEDLKENLTAISAVIGAELKVYYLYIQDVQKNLYPLTAEPASQGGKLNDLGTIHLNRQPYPSTFGIYNLTAEVNSLVDLRKDLTFKSSSGKIFIIDEDVTISPSSNVFEVRSLERGLESKLSIGEVLNVTEPVLGLPNESFVFSIVQSPLSEESEQSYRRSIMDAIQIESQGGSKGDYRLWSNDAEGVRRVYPYVKQGSAGTVQIYVESFPDDSTDGKGTPPQSVIDDVDSVCKLDPDTSKPIWGRSRKPIQAILEVLPIILTPVDIKIIGLAQTSLSLQTSIFSKLESYLFDIRPFIDGGELLRDKNDVLNSARLQNAVNEVISNDNYFNDLELKVQGLITNNYTFSYGMIPFLNSVTYG